MSNVVVALDVPLVSSVGALDPFMVVSRGDLKNLSEHAVMNVCLVSVPSEIPLSSEEFGEIFARRSPVQLKTKGALYYLFSNERASWKVHEPSRKGSGDSEATYPADFDGIHSFGMIQCLARGGVTSNHFHSNAQVRERWIGTFGVAWFLGSSSNYPLQKIEPCRKVISGNREIHQTRADSDTDFECFLLVHGTTRADHMRDHVYVPKLRVVGSSKA